MERGETLPDSGRRILRFLSVGPASVHTASLDGKVLLEAAVRGAISVEGIVLDLLADNRIVVRSSHSVALSEQGALLARQLAGQQSKPQSSHRDIGLISIDSETGPAMVLANLAESPLAQLVRRKTKAGAPFLTTREYEAGERLRADYTRGQIMPRMGANWVASVSSGRRASGGGIADLTDAALGARQRVEKAIAAVGPELSGVLIDICCFLKGLELVETERGWPVRSAKIVLKTALGVLSRHYFPETGKSGRLGQQTLHWGADGYRPNMAL